MKDNWTTLSWAIALAVLAIALTRCQPPLQPYPSSDCVGACHQLQTAGCDEGDPSPERGVPCETWCSQYHAADYMRPWAACVSQATSVDAIRACGLECRR